MSNAIQTTSTDPAALDAHRLGDLIERLRAWASNDPNPEYFFGGDGEVFSMMQSDCWKAHQALTRNGLPEKDLADEVMNCAVFIVEDLLAAGIQSRVTPEDLCELIEPHVAMTVKGILAASKPMT